MMNWSLTGVDLRAMWHLRSWKGYRTAIRPIFLGLDLCSLIFCQDDICSLAKLLMKSSEEMLAVKSTTSVNTSSMYPSSEKICSIKWSKLTPIFDQQPLRYWSMNSFHVTRTLLVRCSLSTLLYVARCEILVIWARVIINLLGRYFWLIFNMERGSSNMKTRIISRIMMG